MSVFFSSADPKEKHREGGGGQSMGGDNYNRNRGGGRDQRGRSISPNSYHDSNNRNGGNNNSGPVNSMNNQQQQNAQPGNMAAGMGFNMAGFPMNPAMFAALASQGMFGMPNMMGPNGPMGGFPNQQQQGFNNAPNGGASFNYGGYGAQPGYGQQQGGFGQQQQQQQQQQPQGASGNGGSQNNYGGSPGNMWGSSGATGDSSKDLKGTAGWSQNSRQEPMNSSSGWGS